MLLSLTSNLSKLELSSWALQRLHTEYGIAPALVCMEMMRAYASPCSSCTVVSDSDLVGLKFTVIFRALFEALGPNLLVRVSTSTTTSTLTPMADLSIVPCSL